MKSELSILLIMLAMPCQLLFSQNQSFFKKHSFENKAGSITIEVNFGRNKTGDSASMDILPIYSPSYAYENIRKKIQGSTVKWVIKATEPYYLDLRNEFSNIGLKTVWLGQLDDDVNITYEDGKLFFSGKGSEKFRLQYRVELLLKTIQKPVIPVSHYTRDLQDFMEWNTYLRNRLALIIPLIDSYKDSLTDFEYSQIKAISISAVIHDRCTKFSGLTVIADKIGLTNQDLCNIFDSTFFGKDETWRRACPFGSAGDYDFIQWKVARKYNFDRDSLLSRAGRKVLYYDEGKKTYSGDVLEKFLKELMSYNVIQKTGFTPETEALLSRYYIEATNPVYKEYVKNQETKARVLRSSSPAPEFKLEAENGKIYSKNDFKDKVVFIDFWFTGCVGCVEMTQAISKLEKTFKNDTNIVFLSVSVDRNRNTWIKSIAGKKYTTGEGLNLYTQGDGDNHLMIKDYNVLAYPSIFLLDGNGQIAQNPLPDPRSSNGEQITALIRKQLTLLHDGPYVLYKDNSANIYTVNGHSVTKEVNHPGPVQFTVSTDEYDKTFTVTLKKELVNEPAEFAKSQKIFALSDIEGNFDALRKLLQSNKIIDENYNWTFGDGHLVCIGDFFDRGMQVTEALWLIYSLEEKAKAAGGYVHFILGNHEIMNLNGDLRYVQPKYIQNIEKLGKEYSELYGINSELGRWLRTKNIMEKIGDLIFVHGGISKELNDMTGSVKQINEVAQPWYDKDSLAQKSGDKLLSLIFTPDEKYSPYWYRLYYLDEEKKTYMGSTDTMYKTPVKVIDEIMAKFHIKHIVTGHTIPKFETRLSVHYNGKIIDTDTRHATGNSDALLIEDDNYYRTNEKGEKSLLFRDN